MPDKSALEKLADGFGLSDSFRAKLAQTWPARMVQSAVSAAALPGDVYAGRVNAESPEYYDRAADLAGLMTGAPGGSGGLGSGVRAIPKTNYLVPMQQHTPVLYREVSPSSALEVLPFSNVSAGFGPAGAARLFYSDVPEMALGQGANRGVRVKYNSDAFEGQIHKKPGWEFPWQSGMGEYLAQVRRNANVRDAVQSVEIDPELLKAAPRSVQMQMSRTLKAMEDAGWTKETKDNLTTWSRPAAVADDMPTAISAQNLENKELLGKIGE